MPARKTLTGLEQVVDEAVREVVSPVPAVEQGSLLPLAVVGELGEGADGEPVAVEAPRGGRQPGARNRKTREWVEFLQRRYQSPLVMLAETYSRPVDELARELGCTKLEAFDRQVEAAKHLAPYMHQKLPTAIELGNADGIPLQLAVWAGLSAVQGGELPVVGEDGALSLELMPVEPSGEAEGER